MMFIFLRDKGIEQITERIYFFHIREFFAFQMRAQECFQGFQQCRYGIAWQYNPIYIKHFDVERASLKL